MTIRSQRRATARRAYGTAAPVLPARPYAAEGGRRP